MNKLRTTLHTALYTGVSAVLLAPVVTLATGTNPAPSTGGTDFGLGNVNRGLGSSLGNRPLIDTISGIINIGLGLLGIVAVVIILIGGFRWMTAAGREDQIDSAKQTIYAGVIGLAIILSSWALATFVITSLSGATNSGNVSAFQA